MSLLVLLAIACVPKPVAPAGIAAPAAAAAPAESEAVPAADSPQAATIGASPMAAVGVDPLVGGPVAPGTDARVLVNAWRVRHNMAVTRLEAGDAPGALIEAHAALALAPAELRAEPLLLVAVAASAAGDAPTAVAALERLGEGARVPWGLYYNGSLDAGAVGRPDLAHRFAQASLAGGGDVAQVAPVAVRAALRVQALDAALVAGRLLPADHPARAELVRALVTAERCRDAESLAPGACP